MKRFNLLLFCLVLLAAACQKAQEPREAVPGSPTVFEQSADCGPITCEHCAAHPLIEPSCCCKITVLHTEEERACIDLCGTSSPLPDHCRKDCRKDPDPHCDLRMGPVHEPNIQLAAGEAHVYCAGHHHSYHVTNCGRHRIKVEINCGGASHVFSLDPGEYKAMMAKETCDALPCPPQ